MIEGYCRTNLDNYKHEEWPEIFVAVPRKGEYIRSKTGKILKVVGVTHYYILEENPIKYKPELESLPRIEIELNK